MGPTPTTARLPAGSWARGAWAVVVRPQLWATALAQAVRLAPPGWWRRPPFVPWPDTTYLRFRLATQYGAEPGASGRDREAAFDPGDVVEYLAWCRAMGRATAGVS